MDLVVGVGICSGSSERDEREVDRWRWEDFGWLRGLRGSGEFGRDIEEEDCYAPLAICATACFLQAVNDIKSCRFIFILTFHI